LKASPVSQSIIDALDDWSACALGDERAWVLNVAKAMDPDPWRDQVRDHAIWANLQHLVDLAATADIARQPATFMVAMGTRWRRLGGDPTDFLLRVQRLHPNEFWVNFELGHLLGATNVEASIGFNRAAIAVRQNASAPHFNLGTGLQKLGRFEDAMHHFERAITVDPNHAWALQRLGFELLRAERFVEAIEPYDRAFALEADNVATRDGWVIAHMRSGRSNDLKAKWRAALALHSAEHNAWDGYAELCLFLGDAEAYQRACDALIDEFGDATDPYICERTGRALLLLPTQGERLCNARELIDRALSADLDESDAWVMSYFQLASALAHFRAQEFDEVLQLTQGDVMTALPPAPHLIRAMALMKQGHAKAARVELDEAIELFDWNPENAVDREAWIFHILRREAELLFDTGAQNASLGANQ
jgi:serine/threonine-protein kinase